jgi:hypothetical protein
MPGSIVCRTIKFVVIPSEVRNLSGFEIRKKEGFLGAQRASE